MTGQIIARKHWRALDRDGEDTCRLSRLDAGWMLVGHARFRDGMGWAALDYVIRMDMDWMTASADITGEHAGQTVAWQITCTEGAWHLNGVEHPDLLGATDIDLSFTPATNLMPLRRLPEVGRLECRAAWLSLPGPQLRNLSQSYTRERGGLVRYDAQETAFETHLRVDPHGFIETYPGLWESVPHG